MKAFILCAGEGKRLIPLTLNRPKPMLPVLNKPLLEHVLEGLYECGIKEFIINLHHKPQIIKEYFRSKKYKITYSQETGLLGTAGAVKKCRNLLKETFLVVYGDTLFEADLKGFFEFHKDKKSKFSVGLMRGKDLTRAGIVLTDENGRISKFKEKPKRGEIFSSLVNAGIYLMEPEILDEIPEGGFYDFGLDFFPRLLASEKQKDFYGFKLRGFFEDIGGFQNFLALNRYLLKRKKNLIDKSSIVEKAEIKKSVIGKNCNIEKGAVINNSVLDEQIHVGGKTRINNTIILKNTFISGEAKISDAVISEGCLVAKGAVISRGVKLWPGSRVSEQNKISNDTAASQK